MRSAKRPNGLKAQTFEVIARHWLAQPERSSPRHREAHNLGKLCTGPQMLEKHLLSDLGKRPISAAASSNGARVASAGNRDEHVHQQRQKGNGRISEHPRDMAHGRAPVLHFSMIKRVARPSRTAALPT
jgi:hypothetical protein